MGMFDSLRVTCQCGHPVEFQSKAGECSLAEYTLWDCPPAVAGDMNNRSEQCEKCGRYLTLHAQVMLTVEQGPPSAARD